MNVVFNITGLSIGVDSLSNAVMDVSFEADSMTVTSIGVDSFSDAEIDISFVVDTMTGLSIGFR